MSPRSTAVRLALAVSALRAARAIEAAANLARAMDAELSAAYIQDEDLLRAAALPCSFEIGMLASGARPFGLPETERALRREAAEVERAIAEAAKNLRLGWTFEVLRGRAIDWPFHPAAADDITVVGNAGIELQFPQQASTHRARQSNAPILAVIDSTPGAIKRLDRILRDLGGSAPVAVWTPEEANAEKQRRAIQTLGKDSLRAMRHVASAEPFSAASVAQVMRTLRPGVVIIARSLAEKIRADLPIVMRLVPGTMIFAP
jgi:hypothetical protein